MSYFSDRLPIVLSTLALVVAIVAVGLQLAGAAPEEEAASATAGEDAAAEPGVLTVRRLVVVDENGVERVVVGAPTLDPRTGEGEERSPRIAPLHGIVINGPDGRERGGYGTAGDEAILTLDAEGGGEVFRVTANPANGATLFVYHQNGSGAGFTTYRGAPELHLLGADGAATRLPEGTPAFD